MATDYLGFKESLSLGADSVTRVEPPAPATPTIDRIVYANGQKQRSRFIHVQIYFNTLVNISKGAFELFLNNKRFVVSSFFITVQDGHTVATLQFPSKVLPFGSLPEGKYRLVTHTTKIKTQQGQAMLHDQTDTFFRLFGDVNGDGVVNNVDTTVFKSSYGKRAGQAGYLWYLDYDGNGRIGAVDRHAFQARLRRCHHAE